MVGVVVIWIELEERPELIVSQEWPVEAERLITTEWEAFRQVFGGKGCLTDVTLVAVRDMPHGDARYVRAERIIEIEIPTSPARFPESLVHELGHHLESSCSVESEIGADFMAAQGMTPPWESGATWYDTPSEHFAEAVVQVVRQQRNTHKADIPLSPEAIEIVAGWARR